MIYLDYNATAPLLQPARDAMAAAQDEFGNASSAYAQGRRARAVLEGARRDLAEIAGVQPRDICFTSGGTESNNAALFGTIEPASAHEIVLAPHDHSSVVESARELERRGAKLRWLPVDAAGRVAAAAVAEAISESTRLVSVGWANNEIGTIQDCQAIAELCRDRGVAFHSDAVQGFGKVSMQLPDADLISITAHKLGGPKGIGALVRRRDVELRPLLFGGSQERGWRPGTENVVGAAGFAAAALAARDAGAWTDALRERLWRALEPIAGVERYSPAANCLPNTLLVGFAGLRGESVVAALDLEGVAVSVGSACAAGSGEPSHVLRALGYDDERARCAVRFSSGRATTADEIDRAGEIVATVVARMRAALEPAAAAGGAA